MLSAQVTKKVDEKSTGTFWIFLEVQMNDGEKPLTPLHHVWWQTISRGSFFSNRNTMIEHADGQIRNYKCDTLRDSARL